MQEQVQARARGRGFMLLILTIRFECSVAFSNPEPPARAGHAQQRRAACSSSALAPPARQRQPPQRLHATSSSPRADGAAGARTRAGGQRRRHEQRRQVLAADGAGQRDLARGQPLRQHLHRRAARAQRAAGLDAQLHQAVHQVLVWWWRGGGWRCGQARRHVWRGADEAARRADGRTAWPAAPMGRLRLAQRPPAADARQQRPQQPQQRLWQQRTWMGRSRMRATPSSTKRPRPAAATAAVSGRIAVPALPRNSSAPSAAGGEGRGARAASRWQSAGEQGWQERSSPGASCSPPRQQRMQGTALRRRRRRERSGAHALGKRPAQPVTTRRLLAQSSSSCTPSTLSASTM